MDQDQERERKRDTRNGHEKDTRQFPTQVVRQRDRNRVEERRRDRQTEGKRERERTVTPLETTFRAAKRAENEMLQELENYLSLCFLSFSPSCFCSSFPFSHREKNTVQEKSEETEMKVPLVQLVFPSDTKREEKEVSVGLFLCYFSLSLSPSSHTASC
jgi:hypothetical protein